MTKLLERVLRRCASFSPEVREAGQRELEELFRAGSAEAGIELAHIVVSEDFPCTLSKADAVDLLVNEVRLTGAALAFLNLYHHGGRLVSDELMGELLPLAAPNCTEAAEILEARLPGWRHPLA